MSKLNKRILLLLSAVVIMTAVALRAVAAPTVRTVSVPLIDTNVPLYVLVDVPVLETPPLGLLIIVR